MLSNKIRINLEYYISIGFVNRKSFKNKEEEKKKKKSKLYV